MNITRGKIATAQKVVIYGPEGIGKSTFAAQFPDPLFIDTEGSTNNMDIARMDKPSSWEMLKQEIEYVRDTPGICRTLVIDTIDWAEQLCIQYICDKHHKSGIEDFGYGNGYVYTKEEMGRLLNMLSDVVSCGIHVILTAHAQIRKFEQPDELGAYDRYELKLGKKTSSQTSPLVKEWADMLLFANYKTFSVATDDKGKVHKAQGGARVMYTSHHPCWDAKNRHGLPEQLPFSYREIANIFEGHSEKIVNKNSDASGDNRPAPEQTSKVQELPDFMHQENMDIAKPQGVQRENSLDKEKGDDAARIEEVPFESVSDPKHIPKALKDLMDANQVDEWDIQWAVGKKGYFPADTPIEKYPEDFIMGCLVGAWPKVYAMIEQHKKEISDIMPFN